MAAEKEPEDCSTVSNRLSIKASTAAVERLLPPAEAKGSALLMPASTTGRTFFPPSVSSDAAGDALDLDLDLDLDLEDDDDDDDDDDFGDTCCILNIFA